jgi:hypothetical protein
MVFLKLRAPPGPERTEVLQLAQIFRAKVNDVSDNTLTLCVSGDPGKVRGAQNKYLLINCMNLVAFDHHSSLVNAHIMQRECCEVYEHAVL